MRCILSFISDVVNRSFTQFGTLITAPKRKGEFGFKSFISAKVLTSILYFEARRISESPLRTLYSVTVLVTNCCPRCNPALAFRSFNCASCCTGIPVRLAIAFSESPAFTVYASVFLPATFELLFALVITSLCL